MAGPNDDDDGLDRDPRQLEEYVAPDAYTSLANRRAYKYSGSFLQSTTVFLPDSWKDSATTWELLYSTLVGTPRLPFSPVVDSEMRVVGHAGWAKGVDIYVPSGSSLGIGSGIDGINRVLREGETILVGTKFTNTAKAALALTPVPLKFRELSTDEQTYFLLTRPDGQVVAALSTQGIGLESADDTLWAIITLGQISISMGRGVLSRIWSLIRMLKPAVDASKIFLPKSTMVLLGAVQDGKLVAHELADGMLRHDVFAWRRLRWKPGALPPNSWVITFGKRGSGEIGVQLSRTFHDSERVAPPEVLEAVLRVFR